MRRPAMRNRGQGSSRRPTPLPSPPVGGGPKGPPVRAVPKTPPKPRPTGSGPYGGRVPKRVKETLTPIKKTPPNTGTKGKGGSGTIGGGRLSQIRGGKSDIRTPRGRETVAPTRPKPRPTTRPTRPTRPRPRPFNSSSSRRTPRSRFMGR